MNMLKQFSIHQFGKHFVALAVVLLSGCASLTPQQITQRIDTMSDFQICLGAQTGLDSRALDLDVAIVAAAKERIAQRKLDCSSKHDEIVRFLVTSLKQEQKYREIYFPRSGFWRF
jgi:outer membrane murein-binding lipoprotein Lpp